MLCGFGRLTGLCWFYRACRKRICPASSVWSGRWPSPMWDRETSVVITLRLLFMEFSYEGI